MAEAGVLKCGAASENAQRSEHRCEGPLWTASAEQRSGIQNGRSWPTGEFGLVPLVGAVKAGYRKELAAMPVEPPPR
jgi:hypothetical protein